MYDFKAKDENIRQANKMTVSKTLSMFKWDGLPDTIPADELEKMLQMRGYAFITEVEGELYALTGALGGEPDVYGNPTTITIANPALRFNKTLNLKKDGVFLCNDKLMVGTLSIIEKYNTFMVENDINMMVEGYNGRINTFISASDDKTYQSAQSFLDKIQGGEMAVIGESAMFDGVRSHTATQSNNIKPLIELQQYHRATLFNELGLSSNFNMKRERLNTSEVEQNDDAIYPFVDNMFDCRSGGCEAINEMFDTNIQVEYNSVWLTKDRGWAEHGSTEVRDGHTETDIVSGSEMSGDEPEEVEVADVEDGSELSILAYNESIDEIIHAEDGYRAA